MLGKVKWFNARRGYGFLLNPDGQEVFLHFTGIVGEGFRSVRDGERVEFEQMEGPKGLYATNVRRVRTPRERPATKPVQPPLEADGNTRHPQHGEMAGNF